MKLAHTVLAKLVLAGIALSSCAPQEDILGEPSAQANKLEGTIDQKMVGTWVTESGSVYDFKADGSFHLEATVKTGNSSMDIKTDGEWRRNGEHLLITDPAKNVVKYIVTKESADAITLDLTGKTKNPVEMKRKK